jgi:hypothetical protein
MFTISFFMSPIIGKQLEFTLNPQEKICLNINVLKNIFRKICMVRIYCVILTLILIRKFRAKDMKQNVL